MYAAIFWVCVFIAIAVFGVMVYSVATFSTSHDGTAVNRRRNAVIEVVWVLIPIAIVVSAAWPAARIIQTQDSITVAAAQ